MIFKMNTDNNISSANTSLSLTNDGNSHIQVRISLEEMIPPEIIEKFLSYLTLKECGMSTPYLVCKKWALLSKIPINILKIKKLAVGSDKWNAKWPIIKILPESPISETMETSLIQLTNKPCPFNPSKLFINTHVITYIREEFSVMTTNEGLKTIPISIAAFDQIFGKNEIFCLYNVESDESDIKMQTIKKAKWVALYKEAIYVFRKDGKKIEPSLEEKHNITIAKENNYRLPTILEYGISFFGYYSSTNKKCSTWLSDSKDRHSITEDSLKDNGQEDRLYVDSNGFGVSTQRESFDRATSRYWDEKGIFGLMVCKDL